MKRGANSGFDSCYMYVWEWGKIEMRSGGGSQAGSETGSGGVWMERGMDGEEGRVKKKRQTYAPVALEKPTGVI